MDTFHDQTDAILSHENIWKHPCQQQNCISVDSLSSSSSSDPTLRVDMGQFCWRTICHPWVLRPHSRSQVEPLPTQNQVTILCYYPLLVVVLHGSTKIDPGWENLTILVILRIRQSYYPCWSWPTTINHHWLRLPQLLSRSQGYKALPLLTGIAGIASPVQAVIMDQHEKFMTNSNASASKPWSPHINPTKVDRMSGPSRVLAGLVTHILPTDKLALPKYNLRIPVWQIRSD